MKITITVDQPTGDFQNRLMALLAEHAADVEIDTTWTLSRAESYYRSLPARAQRIIKEAAARDGYVPAEELRDDETTSLRGHSGPLARALQRGFMNGLWPENMRPPIEPQGPGFGKVVGYRMPDDLVQTFSAAVANTEQTPDDPTSRIFTEAADSIHALAETADVPIPRKAKRNARD